MSDKEQLPFGEDAVELESGEVVWDRDTVRERLPFEECDQALSCYERTVGNGADATNQLPLSALFLCLCCTAATHGEEQARAGEELAKVARFVDGGTLTLGASTTLPAASLCAMLAASAPAAIGDGGDAFAATWFVIARTVLRSRPPGHATATATATATAATTASTTTTREQRQQEYSYDTDARFAAGLTALAAQWPPTEYDQHLANAKQFYYDRFVEPPPTTSAPSTTTTTTETNKVPYPASFFDIMTLVEQGKPIPGAKVIPPLSPSATEYPEQSVAQTPLRKPWQKE